MLFWLPSSSCGVCSFNSFLSNSYWKLVPHALLAALLLLWWFLIKFLLKTGATCSSGCPPPLVVVSYFILHQCLLQTGVKCSSGYLAPLVVDSHATIIEKLWEMLFWLLSPACGCFSFKSCWKLMPNVLLAAPLPLVGDSTRIGNWCWWLFGCPLPLVVVLIQFLFNSFWKKMTNALLATPLLLWWILIQLLLKTNAKYSTGYPPPLVVNSHTILIGRWC